MSNGLIVIKKKKGGGGDGHHGGAWKVAYADFVTAMMAFFMLMWLLNATTETQRKGLADYFNPTVAIARISGGGDGAFGGDSMVTEQTLARSGTGGYVESQDVSGGAPGSEEATSESDDLKVLQEGLLGRGGESLVHQMALEHIVTRVTDEGLVIELFDLEGDPLFDPQTGRATAVLEVLADLLVEVFGAVQNDVAIAAHSAAFPVIRQENPAWDLSLSRAEQMRDLLFAARLDADRVQRVTGYGQQKPALSDPMNLRNNRIEVTLLRDLPR